MACSENWANVAQKTKKVEPTNLYVRSVRDNGKKRALPALMGDGEI